MLFKEFFYFQKNDRIVVSFLIIVAAAVVMLIIMFPGGKSSNQAVNNDSILVEENAVDADSTTDKEWTYAVEERRVERFAFDPNTADSTQLLRLGLRPWQVRNIYKYRAKGGIYREPSDFAQLYGLTVKQYRELEPYIVISDDYKPASTLFEHKENTYERDTLHRSTKLDYGATVDINAADTVLLKRIPGIGSYYARQIVVLRERLGGFYDVSQLMLIDDFPEDALDYIVVGSTDLRKIKVNKLSLTELRRHPYINFFQARDITDYRRMKGDIDGMETLRMLPNFSDSDIERLAPYVEF